MFVFDTGVTSRTFDSFALPPDELRSAKFVDPDDLARYLSPTMVPRLLAAIEGADEGRTIYLER